MLYCRKKPAFIDLKVYRKDIGDLVVGKHPVKDFRSLAIVAAESNASYHLGHVIPKT